MLSKWWNMLAIVPLAVVLAACAPAAAPAPPPALPPAPPPALPPAPPPAPAPPVPAISFEEAAWAKIVEAAKKEGRVLLYGSSGLCCEWGMAVGKVLKEKYGITVEILSVLGRTGLERISVEQQIGRPVADIFQSGSVSVIEAYKLGFTASVWEELPALKDKTVFVMDPLLSPKGEVMNLNPRYKTILISDKVKPEDYPRSYRDLLDPKWKGNIIMLDITMRGGGFPTYGTHSFYKTLDDDYWRAFMKQKPAVWGGSSVELMRMVARGEYLVSIHTGGDASAPLVAEGAPIRGDLAMEEGTEATAAVFTILKNAPHPNASKVMVNFLFSQEGQDVFARVASRTSLRKDVADYTLPRSRVKPKRILAETWDVYSYMDKITQAHLEGIFGKK